MPRRPERPGRTPPPTGLTDRLDEDARRALQAAEEIARRLGQDQIRPEHLLLAVHDVGGPAAVVLHHEGVVESALHDLVERSSPASPIGDGPVPFTRRSIEAIVTAVAIANGRGQATAGPAHLALAVLRQPDTAAHGAVTRLAVDPADLDAALRRLLDDAPEPSAADHRWAIAPREYARMERRRGRRHSIERLDGPRTALVVVDMVPFFLDENPYAVGIVGRVNALAAALRDAGGTVAWVLPANVDATPAMVEHHGPDVAARYATSAGDAPLPERLDRRLDRRDGDLTIEKSAASAFFPGRCDLHDTLQATGIDTVIVVGTVANVCCESTARDASTLGYRTLFVADANAARTDRDLNATLHTIYRSFGDVRPTLEVIELLGSDESRRSVTSMSG